MSCASFGSGASAASWPQVAVDFARDTGYKTARGFIPEQNEPALSFFSAVAPLVQVQGGQFHFEL